MSSMFSCLWDWLVWLLESTMDFGLIACNVQAPWTMKTRKSAEITRRKASLQRNLRITGYIQVRDVQSNIDVNGRERGTPSVLHWHRSNQTCDTKSKICARNHGQKQRMHENFQLNHNINGLFSYCCNNLFPMVKKRIRIVLQAASWQKRLRPQWCDPFTF